MTSIESHGPAKCCLNGTHRIRHPRETIALLRPFYGEMGITRVANVTGLDTVGIPVFVAVRPNARSLSTSQGKGLDLDAAQASAVLEAVEQFHAERPELALLLGSCTELRERQRVCRVDRLPRYARLFKANEPALWGTAREVRSSSPVLVPYDMVHLDMRFPPRHSTGWFPMGSNGLASGNTRIEALAHALWELIERDATALFFAMPLELQSRRRLDLDTVADAGPRSLIDQLVRAELDVAVWDITSDLGLPAFCAIIVERAQERFRVVGEARGYGCHNDRSVALCRALTEAAQSRLTRIVGSRDDMGIDGLLAVREEGQVARTRSQVSRAEGTPRAYSEVPSWTFDTFEDDVALVLSQLERVGIDEVLEVDLSRTGFPISVVRAIVPGLEGAPEVPGYQPGPRAVRAAVESAP